LVLNVAMEIAMPNRTSAHRHAAADTGIAPHGTTPLEQALFENSELKLLLFKTFATLSTYASGLSDGGAQAHKTLDMLHRRMFVGCAHDHDHHDSHPARRAS
jgi:hypothetical protein